MLFTAATTSSSQSRAAQRFSSVIFAIALVLLTLTTNVAALPTSNRRAAALFEPLFHPANPQVGPQRSIERLRQRRAINAPRTVTGVVANPKVKRASIPNPKTKRSKVAAPVVANPKAKRSFVPAIASPVFNPKAKRAAPSLSNREIVAAAAAAAAKESGSDASPVARRSFVNLVRRIYDSKISGKPLDKRDIVPAIVINPKRSLACSTTSRGPRTPTSSRISTTVAAPRTTTTTAAMTTTRTTTVQPIATPSSGAKSCSVTSDCVGQQIPINANQYCNQSTKKCSFRCQTSYTLINGLCTRSLAGSVPATTTARPTTAAPTTRTTTTTTTVRTTTLAPVPSATGGWPTSGGAIAGGYWADWNYETLPVNKIDYDLYDIINYSFAVPTSDFNVKFIGWNSDSLLKSLVATAHARNTKVAIAIGGWSDSKYFSDAVNSASSRTVFVNNIARMVNQYGVDGVDIDWEYPGAGGAAGNKIRSTDTANFLLFLQQLRQVLGAKSHITTSATHRAFIGDGGSPIADVSAFAKVLDGVLVMNYDVWGASSRPGPNAPLTNACPNSLQPNANMLSAIQAWSGAGMPRSKILMGVPAYGYVSASTATKLVNKRSIAVSAPASGSLMARTDAAAPAPVVGLSNRDRATRAFVDETAATANVADTYEMSPFHKAFVEGHARLAERQRVRRALKRAKRQNVNVDSELPAPVFCPGDHSGKPCAGVAGQNLTEIKWSPLDDVRDGTGNSSTGGVFNGNIGKTRLGKGDLSGLEGWQIDYWKLYNYGIIVRDGDNVVGTNGYTRAWDECSSTPYLYDVSRKAVVTFDDPASMAKKGALAKSERIGGILMWEMSGDTQDFELTKAWKRNML